MFISEQHRYEQNVRKSKQFTARAARLTSNAGSIPGIVLYEDGKPSCVFSRDEALRLAHEIANSLSVHNTKNKEA